MNDNYKEKLKVCMDNLNDRLSNEKDYIIAYSLIEKKKSNYHYIFAFLEIINKNLQCGNYKRVFKYYLLAEYLMRQIEHDRENIRKRITDYMLL